MCLDYDRYAYQERCSAWHRAAAGRRLLSGKCSAVHSSIDVKGVAHSVVVFRSTAKLKTPTSVSYSATFVVHPSGHLEVHQLTRPTATFKSWMRASTAEDPGDTCNSIPRIGWQMVFPLGFDAVSWFVRSHRHWTSGLTTNFKFIELLPRPPLCVRVCVCVCACACVCSRHQVAKQE
jgi:hypothetical protein